MAGPEQEAVRAAMLVGEAWEHFEKCAYDRALELFQEAAKLYPDAPGARQGAAASFRLSGRYSEAERVLRLAGPDPDLGLRKEVVWLRLAENKYEEALEALRACLEYLETDRQHPLWEQEHLSILLWLSFVARRLAQYEAAEDWIDRAAEAHPEERSVAIERAWLAFADGRLVDAEKWFDSVIEREPTNPNAIQGKAACLRMVGRYVEARELLSNALIVSPGAVGLTSELAWLFSELGDYPSAEFHFTRIVETAPNDHANRVNLAWTLVRQGGEARVEKAEALCRGVLRVAPNMPDALGCLGTIAFRQGRTREAEALLKASIDADPNHSRLPDLIALYVRIGLYEKAEQLFEGTNPQNPRTHLERGALLLATERNKEALEAFRTARHLDPYSVEAARGIAVALAELGDVRGAERTLHECLNCCSETTRWIVYLSLGQVLLKSADDTDAASASEDALKQLQEAIRLKPDHPDPHFYAGLTRYKLGDYLGALRAFRRCIREDPRNFDARANARRVADLIRVDKAQGRVSLPERLAASTILLVQLGALWYFHVVRKVIDVKTFAVLLPLVLVMLLLAILLPWFSKLKVTGLEAELSQPKSRETLGSGPRAELSYVRAFPITGG